MDGILSVRKYRCYQRGRYIINTYNHVAAQIKSEFTGKYKEAFGKGPETTIVSIIGDVVIIKLKGFLTPIERSMYKLPDGLTKIKGIRDVIYKPFISDLENVLKRLTDRSVTRVLKCLNSDGDKEYIFIIMEGVINKTE